MVGDLQVGPTMLKAHASSGFAAPNIHASFSTVISRSTPKWIIIIIINKLTTICLFGFIIRIIAINYDD